MRLGFICKVQKLLDKTSVLLEKHTPSFLWGRKGILGYCKLSI